MVGWVEVGKEGGKGTFVIVSTMKKKTHKNKNGDKKFVIVVKFLEDLYPL